MSQLEKKTRDRLTRVEKTWGHELWVDNRPEYCGKVLEFVQDRGTSWHFHQLKLETMHCLQGLIEVQLVDDGRQYSVMLSPGENLLIPREQIHRIVGRSERAQLLEVSTQHFDDDSYRVWAGDREEFGK